MLSIQATWSRPSYLPPSPPNLLPHRVWCGCTLTLPSVLHTLPLPHVSFPCLREWVGGRVGGAGRWGGVEAWRGSSPPKERCRRAAINCAWQPWKWLFTPRSGDLPDVRLAYPSTFCPLVNCSWTPLQALPFHTRSFVSFSLRICCMCLLFYKDMIVFCLCVVVKDVFMVLLKVVKIHCETKETFL